jgi:hypothetical protein
MFCKYRRVDDRLKMRHNKLLQQIWRLVLNPVCRNGMLTMDFKSLGLSCSAAKQLNRTMTPTASLLLCRSVPTGWRFFNPLSGPCLLRSRQAIPRIEPSLIRKLRFLVSGGKSEEKSV